MLNPYWGIARFRRGEVWWYPGRWVGRLPLDYLLAVGGSFAVAGLAWALGGGAQALRDQLVIVAILAATCVGCFALAGRLRPLVPLDAPPGLGPARRGGDPAAPGLRRHGVMTTLPRACPPRRWRMASGTASSG